MEEYKHIVEESIEEFLNWLKIREVSSKIRNIKITTINISRCMRSFKLVD